MKIRSILLFVPCLAFVGCDRGQLPQTAMKSVPRPAEISLPPLDSSTPDRALKSYWAVKDFLNTLDSQRLAQFCTGRERDFARLGTDVAKVMG